MKPLNAAMAAAMIAVAAESALPATAHYVPSVKTCAERMAQETNPVNVLVCFIKEDKEARKDIGDRLVLFVHGKDSKGRRYMTKELLDDKKLLPAALVVARQWPEKNAGEPAKVATLYFVVGPEGKAPAWAKGTLLEKTLKPGMSWRDRLEATLADAHYTDQKQISPKTAADAVAAFLNDAAQKARAILDDPRTKTDIGNVVGAQPSVSPAVPGAPKANAAGAPAVVAPPPSSTPRPNPLNPFSELWNLHDLYESPACAVGHVYGPDDNGWRNISVTINTLRLPTGELYNAYVVTDLTNPSAPYMAKPIPVSSAFPVTFSIKPGGRKYTLNVNFKDGEHMISLVRTGAKKEPRQGIYGTSQERLMLARADLAAAGGLVTLPNGKQYYALGQGGRHGTVLFYRKEDIDNRDKRRASTLYLRPVAILDVSKVDADGLTAPMDGKPDMGLIDGKPYHGEFNSDTQTWEVKEGKGDPPADAPKPSTTTVTTDGTKPAAEPTDDTPVGRAAAAAKAAEGWEEWKGPDANDKKGGNQGFDADVSKLVRIVNRVDADGNRHFRVFFDPSLKVKDNEFLLALKTKMKDKSGNEVSQTLKDVRGFKSYLVFEFPKFVQYFRYKVFSEGAGKMLPDNTLSKGEGMRDVGNVDMALDMLVRYFGVAPDDGRLSTIRERVAAHKPKTGGYTLDSNAKGDIVSMQTAEGTWQIWPNDIVAGDKGGNKNWTDLRGPGTVMTLSGGKFAPFPAKTAGTEPQDRIAQGTGIALYKGEKTELAGDGTAKKTMIWSVMIAYKNSKGVPSRSSLIDVFGGTERYALPGDYKMQGLPEVNLGSSALLKVLGGSSDARGAIVVNHTTADPANAKKSPCAGPVIWWGMSQAEADKFCHSKTQAVQ